MKKLAIAIFCTLASGGAIADGALPSACSELKKDGIFVGNADIRKKCEDYATALLDKQAAIDATATAKETSQDRQTAREKDIANTEKELGIYTSLKDSLKRDATSLPELSAFQSVSQRAMTELSFDVGRDIGNQLLTAIKGNKGLLITSDAVLLMWRTSVDKASVLSDLASISTQADELIGKSCYVKDAPKTPKGGKEAFWSAPVAIAKVTAIGDGIAYGASLFQPVILKAAAATAPADLQSALSAGVYSTAGTVLVSDPPLVSLSNSVVVAAKQVESGLAKLVKHVESHGKPKKGYSIDSACMKTLEADAKTKSDFYKEMVTGDAVTGGSKVDRAARAEALASSGIAYFVEVKPIVSGGAVTGYQRTRFNAVKLVAGSDISVVYRVVTPTGQIVAANLISRSKGRVIPLGEFETRYEPAK